jgi:hypothetical protein
MDGEPSFFCFSGFATRRFPPGSNGPRGAGRRESGNVALSRRPRTLRLRKKALCGRPETAFLGHSEVRSYASVPGPALMAAITISAPIVAKAPVAVRRARVQARAAVAPAASTSAVRFGARKMMTGASVRASRAVQSAAGRKALVWCVLDPRARANESRDTSPEPRSALGRAREVAAPARRRDRDAAEGFGRPRKRRSRRLEPAPSTKTPPFPAFF